MRAASYSLVGFSDFNVEGTHMRRAIGVILVVLGSLFIGIGLLAKPYLYDQLAIAPLDQGSTSISQGTDMAVLYPHVVDGAPAIDKLTGSRS